MITYKNPIINKDMPDPDVIKYKDCFLMVTSSFNFVPGLPLYYSKDLIHWKLVTYLFPRLPGKKFNNVHLGHGIWAPSIRKYKDTIYVLAPFPDEGIYVCKSKNPLKKWSKPYHLLKGKGIEDPCPIWINNKTYIVVAFVKSRIGFNSKLAVFEANETLTKVLSPLRIIYDGTFENKTIEGPKFYKIDDYIYIFAPAGGVEHGYQLALRSKNIYGPYEWKIILKEYFDTINGPHQGALVEYKKDKYVFFHFQDKGALGRVLHLQPVKFISSWPLIGENRNGIGAPIKEHTLDIIPRIYAKKHTLFTNGKYPLLLQTPCNHLPNSYYFKNKCFYLKALKANTNYKELKNAHYLPLMDQNMDYKLDVDLDNLLFNEECGLIVLGYESFILSIKKLKTQYRINIISLTDNKQYLRKMNLKETIKQIELKIEDLKGTFLINDQIVSNEFTLSKGNWVGCKIGIYARSNHVQCGMIKIIKGTF